MTMPTDPRSFPKTGNCNHLCPARLWHTFGAAFLAVSLIFVQVEPIGAKEESRSKQAPPPERDKRWLEDIDYFANELPVRQKDFLKLIPARKFEHQVTELKRDVHQLSDADIVLRLVRITASLRVQHTRVYLPYEGALAFHWYPLRMKWYSDGLRVEAACPAYQEALGARVVKIGALSPEQAVKAIAPYVTHENSIGLHDTSPRFLQVAEVLEHLNMADPDGRVKIAFARLNEKPFTLEIDPAAAGTMIEVEAALQIPPPLFLKQPKTPYWFKYLPETQALYVQYNQCRDSPDYSFQRFTQELFALADARPVRRVIVDLRLNEGGSSRVVAPLLEGLTMRPPLSARGHLYVLIGPATLSSGLIAACALSGRCTELCNQQSALPGVKQNSSGLKAILVGQPTGEKPNHYGEALTMKLPNSGLLVQYAVKYFRLMPADSRSLEPDVPASRSMSDALSGRDPVLDAALGHLTR